MPPSDAVENTLGFTATVPLHLRYLAPSNASHSFQTIPWPAVFFACPSESSGSKLAAAPFDRVNLGYDGLMGSNGRPKKGGTSGANTIFYQVPPSRPGGLPNSADGRAVSTLMVPVLDLGKAEWVEWGTMGVALLGAVWLLLVLGKAVKRHGVGSGQTEKES
jgi:hypothetical protein